MAPCWGGACWGGARGVLFLESLRARTGVGPPRCASKSPSHYSTLHTTPLPLPPSLQWGTLLDEFFAHVVPYLPTGPKAPRDFPASEDARVGVQMAAAAVLQMIQVGRDASEGVWALCLWWFVSCMQAMGAPPAAAAGSLPTRALPPLPPISTLLPSLPRPAWTCRPWTATLLAWQTATRAPPPAPTTFGRCASTGVGDEGLGSCGSPVSGPVMREAWRAAGLSSPRSGCQAF